MAQAQTEKDPRQTVSLTPAERVHLLQLLPQQGSVATVRLLRDLNNKIGFEAAELGRCFEVGPNGQLKSVKPEVAEKAKPLKFHPLELALIVKALRPLDEKEELSIAHLTLWEKFVDGLPILAAS